MVGVEGCARGCALLADAERVVPAEVVVEGEAEAEAEAMAEVMVEREEVMVEVRRRGRR